MQPFKTGNNPDCIYPDWQAPSSIVALCTTRSGGVSKGGFDSFNLATHVSDEAELVTHNRRILRDGFNLPSEPEWLIQTHSTDVINLNNSNSRQGDAAFTSTIGKVAVVLTADCLPVLFCNRQGNEVAAAHAGWKGLLNGVLERTIENMQSHPSDVMAWLGPAIGPAQFEVGEEVRQQFMQRNEDIQRCFSPNRAAHYLADLYAIAKFRLKKQGITHISGGQFCTFTDRNRFFSYRREKHTGRQASLIYIKK